MAIYFEQTNRLMIPRWRKFFLQNITEEHKTLFATTVKRTAFSKSLERKKREWEIGKTYGSAWELINSAYINQDYSMGEEAARFLSHRFNSLSKNLQSIITEILVDTQPASATNENEITILSVDSLMERTKQEIKSVKRKISFYLRNEFLWLELGRLYCIIGDLYKAEQCIRIASYFSNNYNRYFLRCVSRFYYHIGRYDEAQNIIRRSPYLKGDPWLLSADISYANKMERHAVNAKTAIELLESNKYSNQSITELAGVLGTMELKNNSLKKARKFTRQSLLAPNDNSLAQAEWISREIKDISIEPWMDKISYGYEARTFEYLHANNFDKTLDESLRWVMDQPFSKRACHFVSYFCIGPIQKYKLAIEVGELGANSNPDHFAILNNLSFAYSSVGDFSKAESTLEKLVNLVTDARELCFALATSGYYYYRTKDLITGEEFYQKAISNAVKNNFSDLKRLAEASLLREKYLAGQLSYLQTINALDIVRDEAKKYGIEEQINYIIAMIKLEFSKLSR